MQIDLKRYAPVLGIAILAAAVLLSNRPAAMPDGTPVIADPSSYQAALDRADRLVQSGFAKDDAGQDLNDDDRAALKQAAGLYDAMNSFEPARIGPYLGAAKCYFLTGEYDLADARLRQMISNVKLFEKSEAGRLAGIEAKHVLAQVRYAQKRYQESFDLSDETVKAVPGRAPYLTARASAAVQLKKIALAKSDVEAALNIDPNFPRAQMLARLLEHAK